MENAETRSPEDIAQSTERLLQDLKNVVHDGEALLKAGVRDLSERGVAARERLASALEAAKQTRQKIEERTKAGAQATDRLIREHPYQSIGIAFAVGVLAGVLLSRK